MADTWNLSGDYFEVCNCDIACPCVFTSDPTHGDCTVVIGWHVAKGRSGSVSLDGFNFALAAYSPGNMLKTKWDVAVYIDEKASPAQRDALGAIVGGQAGGPFAAFGPLIGKVHGMRYVPISFSSNGKRHSLEIPSIAQVRSGGFEGADGGEVKIAGAPLLMVPEATVARGEKLSLVDYGWKWDTSGGNSFYSRFEMKGP